jgi:hypothetical protein
LNAAILAAPDFSFLVDRHAFNASPIEMVIMVAPPSDVAIFDAPASAMSTTAAEKRTKKREQPTATQPTDCQKKSGKTLFPTSMGAKHNGSAILNMPRSESPLQTTSVGKV